MVLFPQVIVVLALLGTAFALAAVPLARRPSSDRRSPLRLIVPRPDQPSSMLSFAVLPAFLMLMTLARFGLFLAPVIDPVNSPGSDQRLFWGQRYMEVSLNEANGSYDLVYPRNTADLTAAAARRAESGPRFERIRAIRDLAWWTGVCPNYVPFTVPRLARALRDPDPAVKGAAATELGSTGGHGATAIPDLQAARGSSVKYFDYVVAEAVFLIGQSGTWPPEKECEDVSVEEMERRAVQQGAEADEPQPRY